MALSALDDLSKHPDPSEVSRVLASAADSWTRLVSWLQTECAVDTFEWMTSGQKYGWALRAKKGKRTIVYLIPQADAFLVGLVLGDRAVEAARNAPLSDAARAVLGSARRYGEGTGFRLPVTLPDDLTDVEHLVRIKLAF